MKKYYLRHMALTGLAALFALQACNREPDLMQQPPTALQAADARAWYLAGGGASATAAQQPAAIRQRLPLLWKQAHSISAGEDTHLIIPITDTYDRFYLSPYRAYRCLVIRRHGAQLADGMLIELLVKRTEQATNLPQVFSDFYLAQRNGRRYAPQDFAGGVFFYSADHAYLNGYSYNHGLASEKQSHLRLHILPAQLRADRLNFSSATNDGTCNGNDDDDPDWNIDLPPVVVTGDGGGGDNPPPPPTWDPGPDVPDPPPHNTPTAPGDGGGDWGGGYTPSNPTTTPTNTLSIDTKNLKPCESAVMNSLTGLNGNAVLALLQLFAGNTAGYNWTVKDGSLDPGQYGSTSSVYNRASQSVITTFDANQWQDATDLSMARTMLHESVHAYLVAYLANDPINFNATYSDMLQAWLAVKHPNLETIQHQEMVKFVGDVANSLEAYGISKGYGLPKQFYADMAWGGLESTKAFQSLPYADRTRISNTLRTEISGTDTSGNPTTQSGRKGGC